MVLIIHNLCTVDNQFYAIIVNNRKRFDLVNIPHMVLFCLSCTQIVCVIMLKQ